MSDTPSPASPQSDMVRLYNKTERKFSHELALEDGSKKRFDLPAGTFARVPREVADKWLKMFPGQVVLDEEAHASLNGMRAELEAAQKKIAELEKAKTEAAPAPKKSKSKPAQVEAV